MEIGKKMMLYLLLINDFFNVIFLKKSYKNFYIVKIVIVLVKKIFLEKGIGKLKLNIE